ncbi:Disintegrin and metalloproteinase domain-containing protein 8 [Collichthys lucidus]|uniref:Disintegrin and metalloproteinase domain-containing protein 8 n=1 Tax=Collichthys lucidus TaxID=240159 RepID=A0A4U5VLW4_COLLU|nr:Disintegrin and metalloproteinase domain-containing protein 8 [Collichthys lucidus]
MMGENTVSLWLTCVCLVQTSGMLSHVERYEVVRPQRLHVREKRSLQDNQEHCYYHGHIEGMKDSSVSVGICSGISGFVRARQQLYLIEPLAQSADGDHAVYRQENLKTGSNTTGLYDQDKEQSPQPAGLFRSRSWKSNNAERPQRFVELFVVVDNAEYKRFGSETKTRILQVINHVDKLYRSVNIRIMLVGLEIWSYKDQIYVDSNSEKALDNFLVWRQADLLKRAKHDNAQFVTGIDFEGDTVGLANKFAMCTENSGGVNQDHHDNAIGLASTIAHEMGHNFGLSHDAAGCVCGPFYSSGNCVMADKLRTGTQAFPEFFSDCSVQQLAEFMERAQPSCLSKPPSSVETIAVSPRCGNALLDPGEECDCGPAEECKNPCCDAATCRLTEGSQCAHGQCCDNCQLKLAGSVCRKSASSCDLPEYCTGASEHCPEDSFEMNGKACFNQAQGYCYNGQVPHTRAALLEAVWKRVGMEMCFDLNKRGESDANCGKSQNGYTPCTAANLKCGSIFCGEGGESITGKRSSYIVYGIDCKVPVDDDKTRNMNMVPQGAKCGENKVCLDNRCVELSVYGGKEECSKKCNNNGVCNHKKECHCNPGWAPPYCDIQYADLPHGQNGIIAGVCAVIGILLVFTMLIAGLMCCKKDKDSYISRRSPSVKDRPQISSPTFMESTATPLVTATPCRAAPQPPKKFPSASPTSQPEPMKPQPPSKPLPPLNKTQYQAAKPSAPPVPPVKPSPPPVPPVKPSSPPAARAGHCPPPPLPPAKPQVHRLS